MISFGTLEIRMEIQSADDLAVLCQKFLSIKRYSNSIFLSNTIVFLSQTDRQLKSESTKINKIRNELIN